MLFYPPKRKKRCIVCKKEFIPKVGASFTCSRECSKINRNRKARKRFQRDKEICKVRKATNNLLIKWGIKRQGKCPNCRKIKKLEVHHLNYTPEDFILICKQCHLKGHKAYKTKRRIITKYTIFKEWKKVKKKPVVVRALILKEDVMIRTLEGNMFGCKGDWLIKGVRGEIYPCKPEIFKQTYEEVK